MRHSRHATAATCPVKIFRKVFRGKISEPLNCQAYLMTKRGIYVMQQLTVQGMYGNMGRQMMPAAVEGGS